MTQPPPPPTPQSKTCLPNWSVCVIILHQCARGVNKQLINRLIRQSWAPFNMGLNVLTGTFSHKDKMRTELTLAATNLGHYVNKAFYI